MIDIQTAAFVSLVLNVILVVIIIESELGKSTEGSV